MATPKSPRTRRGLGAKPKKAAKEAKPEAREIKPVARKGRGVAPAKGARAKTGQGVGSAAPPVTPVAPETVSAIEERKEGHMADTKQLTPGEFLATVLVPQYSRDSGHVCWDCKHFKPVLKGSKFPPADTIGWCTMIHWPFYWCVTDFNVVKKCYAFEKGVYSTKKF